MAKSKLVLLSEVDSVQHELRKCQLEQYRKIQRKNMVQFIYVVGLILMCLKQYYS